MFSKEDWRIRLEFITTVFSKTESQTETSFIVFLVVVAAVVLIEWNLRITRSIKKSHLLKVLTFQSNGLMIYSASGLLGGVSRLVFIPIFRKCMTKGLHN